MTEIPKITSVLGDSGKCNKKNNFNFWKKRKKFDCRWYYYIPRKSNITNKLNLKNSGELVNKL